MTKPHVHAALIKAWADGAEIESQCPITNTWYTDTKPKWAERGNYRVKPKTVKTRARVAAMGEPNGDGKIWTWSVYTDEHAAQTERNGHFLCWLGDWHEVERPEPPAAGTLRVGLITAAKISDATITMAKTALGAAQAMGFDMAKRVGDQTPPPVPRPLSGGVWFGIDPAAAESDITALLFVYGKPGQENPAKADG